MSINRRQIAEGLRQAGVLSGRLLIVHASLSNFGHVEGGASAVVEALLDAVGPEGSAFMPTFNFGKLPYDAVTTPSLTGVISECFRQSPHALRSPHPTHPLCGIGPRAAAMLGEHPIMRPFGDGSPLWRLWQQNAQIVLLGCDHRSNSMVHVAEEQAQAPYLERTRIQKLIEAAGEREITVRRPPCSNGFNVIDAPLRRAGHLIESRIGTSKVLLMQARDVVEAAVELIRQDAAALTCREPQCIVCPESRRMIG